MTDSPVPDPIATGDSKSASTSRRRNLRAIVGVAMVALVGVFLVLAVTKNWAQIRDDVSSLGIGHWALSFVFGAIGIGLTWASWSEVLAGMGAHLGGHDSRALFFTGQLGKYVPGSVWTAVIQSELGKRHGIPRTAMVAGYAYSLMLGLASGGLVGLLSLVRTGAGDALWPSIAAAVGSFVGMIFLVHPRGLLVQASKLAVLAKRNIAVRQPEGRHVVAAISFTMVSWIFLGLHILVVARPLGADLSDFPVLMGGFALAYVAGIVALPVPGGAGVREGILVVTIGSAVGSSSALTVALISRFVLLAVDVLLAVGTGAIPLLSSARQWRRNSAGATDDPAVTE